MSGIHVQHEIRNNSEYPCGVINKTSFNHDNFYPRNILYHSTKNLSISKLYIIIISIFGQYRIMAKSISFICNRTAIFVRIWHEAANQNSTSRFPHDIERFNGYRFRRYCRLSKIPACNRSTPSSITQRRSSAFSILSAAIFIPPQKF